MKLDTISDPRQLSGGEDERGLFCVRPSHPLRLKTHRSLVSPGPHQIAVDCLEEGFYGLRAHRFAPLELVGGLEPVDTSVLTGNEAIEARYHVNSQVSAGLRYRIILWHVLNPNGRGAAADSGE